MRPIPIPKVPGYPIDTLVIGEDDPTRDDIRPVEYMLEVSQLYPGRLTFSALILLEDEDVQAIEKGSRKLWLTLDGAEVPWSLGWAEEVK